MMTDEKIDQMLERLGDLVKLAALQQTAGMTQSAAILHLSRANLDNRVIAEICGTQPNSVRSVLAQARKKQGARRRGRKPKEEA